MKQILAVSWEMPPLSGPRAVQVTRTLRELARLGWRARVICFAPRSTRYQQDYPVALEAETGGAVQRIGLHSPEEWLLFRALWRVCPPLKWWPDEKRVWAGRAIAAGRRAVAEQPADLIVSFAQPWSDHLVGLRLHAETGLPWVAHFSDPWVDSPYLQATGRARRYSERLERDVIASATRVVFVNQHTADRVMAKYPAEWTARARVVPQGYESVLSLPTSARRERGPMRLVYTGRFYDGHRTPAALLLALSVLNARRPLEGRLRLEIVGGAMAPYKREAARMRLASVVQFAGRRSPSQAMAIAATADVLLVIDAPSESPSVFLPSKLIDYLPLGKPILGLTPLEGASADLLGRLGYAAIDPTDAAGIADAIERLLAAHEGGTLTPSAHHGEVARAYDIRETTLALQTIFDEALTAA